MEATSVPSESLLSPDNHALIMIDCQSQMAFAVQSIDPVLLRNNNGLVAQSSKIFKVPVILTTIAEKTFSGPIFDEIKQVYPGTETIDRTMIDAWEDRRITDAVNKTRKKKIVMAGLWTSVCIADPALSALDEGFDVYVIADACGDVSKEAHERALQRMIQRGVIPMTSLQYLLELQRDWSRKETYDAVNEVAIKFGGAYGIGIAYAKAMLRGK